LRRTTREHESGAGPVVIAGQTFKATWNLSYTQMHLGTHANEGVSWVKGLRDDLNCEVSISVFDVKNPPPVQRGTGTGLKLGDNPEVSVYCGGVIANGEYLVYSFSNHPVI
jgi:hypothetical protein